MSVIAIGSDHAGFEYKELIIGRLADKGYVVADFGCYSSESVDYPDFMHPVADSIETGFAEWGIILCGSGNGAAMTANKHQEIRAAICWNAELTSLARQHNDANILTIPARYVDAELALKMVDIFLETVFEGGRHQRRVDKISI